MKLHVTPLAHERLLPLMHESSTLLQLWYDIEGCGCGVNGVPTIRLIKEKKNTHEKVECDNLDVVIEKQQAIFFDERLTLDWRNGAFRLTSPSEILNPVIPTRSIIV